MRIRLSLILSAVMAIAFLSSGCRTIYKQNLKDAQAGNTIAQGRVAVSYLIGYQTPVDYHKAFEWASKAIAAEDPCGYYVLGKLYSSGLGNVRINHAKAKDYFERAASGLQIMREDSGSVEECLLADLYLHGLGVDKRPASALFLLDKCSWRYPPASVLLGDAYLKGIGVKADINRAAQNYKFAAEKHLPEGQYSFGLLFEERSKRYDVAAKWYREAVKLNYPHAMYRLGLLIESGKVPALNGEKSSVLFQKAAAMGYAPALTRVAGQMLENNTEAAVQLLWAAVNRNYPPAMFELGKFMEMQDDRVSAMELFVMARKQDFTEVVAPMVALDRKTGYFLPVSFAQRYFRSGSDLVEQKSPIKRILAGFKAGLSDGALKVFKQELDAAPEKFYFSCDWLRICEAGIPLAPAGDILAAAMVKHQNDPGFWFIYASCAGRAGQFEAAMFGADKIIKTLRDDPDRELLSNLAAIIKMNALIGLGREKDAYNFIFSHGAIKRNTLSISLYVNNWANLVLKNKQQFSVATGLKMELLGEAGKVPTRQPFFDAETGQKVLNPGVIPEPVLKINLNPAGK